MPVALIERVALNLTKVSPAVRQLRLSVQRLSKDSHVVEFLNLSDGHAEADLHDGLVRWLRSSGVARSGEASDQQLRHSRPRPGSRADASENPDLSHEATCCLHVGQPTQWHIVYTGVTNDLVRRIWEHRNELVEGLTKRYGVHSLVYFELHDDMPEAIRREKQIKKWNRAWKIELIERTSPHWQDLWRSLTEGEETDSRMRGNNAGCVVPKKAGTQELPARLDSRLCGNDRGGRT